MRLPAHNGLKDAHNDPGLWKLQWLLQNAMYTQTLLLDVEQSKRRSSSYRVVWSNHFQVTCQPRAPAVSCRSICSPLSSNYEIPHSKSNVQVLGNIIHVFWCFHSLFHMLVSHFCNCLPHLAGHGGDTPLFSTSSCISNLKDSINSRARSQKETISLVGDATQV